MILEFENHLWHNILSFIFDCCQEEKMVSISIFKRTHADGRNQILALVPRQMVTQATTAPVEYYDLCNLTTGETTYFVSGSPDRWSLAGETLDLSFVGEILSHGYMPPFFSATTDASQLKIPGTYLCIGAIDLQKQSFQAILSVVADGKRQEIIRLTASMPIESNNYHFRAMAFVKKGLGKKYLSVKELIGKTVGQVKKLIETQSVLFNHNIIQTLNIKTVNNRRDAVYMEPDLTRLDVAVTSPDYHPSYMTPDSDVIEWIYPQEEEQ